MHDINMNKHKGPFVQRKYGSLYLLVNLNTNHRRNTLHTYHCSGVRYGYRWEYTFRTVIPSVVECLMATLGNYWMATLGNYWMATLGNYWM